MHTSLHAHLPAAAQAQAPFGIYDVFFWRDAPDWYRKTFLSAGFGLNYCALRQYLNRCRGSGQEDSSGGSNCSTSLRDGCSP